MALGSSDASDRGHGGRGGGAQRLSGAAVRRDRVLDGRAFVAVGAVVVADEHVAVDVAEADEVVSVLLAGFDAGLVAFDARVYDAGVGVRFVVGMGVKKKGRGGTYF